MRHKISARQLMAVAYSEQDVYKFWRVFGESCEVTEENIVTGIRAGINFDNYADYLLDDESVKKALRDGAIELKEEFAVIRSTHPDYLKYLDDCQELYKSYQTPQAESKDFYESRYAEILYEWHTQFHFLYVEHLKKYAKLFVQAFNS